MTYDDFLKMLHKETIENFKFKTFGYQKDYAVIENASLGYVPFLNNFGFEEIGKIIPTTNKLNRCGIKREYTEYIVVHDTASGDPTADANAHANWLMSMATNPESDYCVSWHYTVDDKGYINHVPDDEVCYHAGDGTQVKLEFIDTNVKNTGKVSVLITDDGYFEVNGQKTNLLSPRDKNGNVCQRIPYLGINTKISKNNTIMISNTYYNSGFDTVANRGGNLNSIGIETCVNYGHDYIKTMRITAYLVAKLLIKYNLDINSVKQHNSFSGKDCPMTIRKAHLWEEFIDLVSLNLYRMKELKDVSVKFESLSLDYLDNTGKIINYKENEEIQYKVTIGKNEYIFKSKLGRKNF